MIQDNLRYSFQAFLENIPVLYVSVGNKGEVIGANKLFYQNLGFEEGSLNGVSLEDIMETETAGDFRNILNDCKSEGLLHVWKFLDHRKQSRPFYRSIIRSAEGSGCYMHCMLKEAGVREGKSSTLRKEVFLRMIPEIIFRLDKKGRYLDYHTLNEDFLAVPPEKFIGKTIYEIGLDKSLSRNAGKLIKKALEEKHVQEFTYTLRKDGQDEHSFEAMVIPLDTEEVLFIVNDITERVRAENVIKYSEQQFGELYDNIPVGIYKTTPGGKVMMANNTFYEILGLDNSSEIKALDLNVILASLGYDRSRFIKEVEQKGSLQGYEDKITALDGKQRYLRENARAVRDSDGQTIYYEGTVVDITALRKTQRELRQAEIEKSAILNSMQEWFVFCDTNLTIQWVSSTAANSIGINATELTGNHYDEIWQGTEWKCEPCPVRAVLDTGVPQKGEVRTRDGRIWILSGYPVLDDDGNIIGVTEFGQEVTVQRKYEEELKKAKEMAEKANRFKSEFLSNISHEIRTPLNVIIGFTDLLDGSLTDPTFKDYLDSIKASSNSIVRLVDDILDISRIEAGKFNLQYKSVNIYKMVKDLKQMFMEKVVRKQLEFLIRVEKSIPKMLILDEVRVKQIITNLLSNAIKYTDHGQVRLDIYITGKNMVLGSEEIDLCIKVEDTGIGIPEEEYNNIFEPFMQVQKNRSKRKGYGLGLAITKRLIELMDGSIQVESSVGHGSVFTVSLPQVMVQNYTLSYSSSSDIPKDVYQGKTILVVDDSDFNRRLVKENLENLGVKILEAEDGQQAILMAKQHRPDLILMDILMPRMDGFEATRIMRGNPELFEIPIVALTALAMKEDVEKIEGFGFNDYLLKPFHITDLLDKIGPLIVKGTEEMDNNDDDIEHTITVSVDQKKLKQALGHLQNELTGEYNELLLLREFASIKRFAEKLLSVGASSGIAEITEYGEDLFNYSKDYDVENINIILEAFPRLIDKLISLKV
ncbi:MAG: PAS domain-containing protein [Bacteroidetes bacterium]|nr:PAS domain-containing protein [Bacteroidota bacterium]